MIGVINKKKQDNGGAGQAANLKMKENVLRSVKGREGGSCGGETVRV